MQTIVTIAERKARALKTRRDAIAAAIEDLRAYAAEKGGRFLVFGSAATGHVRYDSDLDVIVDFPKDLELAAFLQAEIICADRGLPYDLHFMPHHSTPFIERVRSYAVELA